VCIVTEAEIDRCRNVNRSLSKALTRRRKIDENIGLWEYRFGRHIEQLWASGADLSTVTTLPQRILPSTRSGTKPGGIGTAPKR
jgi:hypothetical protein